MGLIPQRMRTLMGTVCALLVAAGATVAVAETASPLSPALAYVRDMSQLRQNASLPDAKASGKASTIKFCDYGGYVAEGAISFYRVWDGANAVDSGGPWTTEALQATNRCQSFTLPAGQGITAAISLHDSNGTAWSGQTQGWAYDRNQNGHATSASQVEPKDGTDETIIAEFELAATYTNVEFDMWGTSCNPYYTISHNDENSGGSTAIVEMDEDQHCGSDESGGINHIKQSNADIEKFTEGLPSLLRTIYDRAFH